MKKFDTIKKEFFEFLEYDKGYSVRTIENYERDIKKFEVYSREFSIDYKKLSKENIFDFHSDLSSSIPASAIGSATKTLCFDMTRHNQIKKSKCQ